jgi:phosphopantothenoylcysteine decarboxylase/phosphopantothenate--cysteine ligase
VLAGKTVILGVTGGIAAHYVPELIGVLRQRHMVAVRVVMTEAATRFITPLTLETASGNLVAVGLFEAAGRWPVVHVNLTAIIMATRAPVVLAPAMNPQMWANPIVQGNIGRLRELGYHFVEPRVGVLATGEQGMGCMAEVNAIVTKLIEVARELPTEVENQREEA